MDKKLDFFEKQDALKNYCKNHPLNRPPENWKSLLKYIIGWCCFYFIMSILFHFFAGDIIPSHFKTLVIIVLTCTIILLSAKSFLITAVKVYQHYAPEQIRRKCICKPSCSEYALLALNKYNLFVAIKMIYNRLFDTCRGPLYLEDYP